MIWIVRNKVRILVSNFTKNHCIFVVAQPLVIKVLPAKRLMASFCLNGKFSSILFLWVSKKELVAFKSIFFVGGVTVILTKLHKHRWDSYTALDWPSIVQSWLFSMNLEEEERKCTLKKIRIYSYWKLEYVFKPFIQYFSSSYSTFLG